MAHAQGSNPEGAWWSVTARNTKGQLVLASIKERNEADARKVQEAWQRKEYVESVEVKSW